MTRDAKAPAPVLVGLPCGKPSAWHSGAHVFPPEPWRDAAGSVVVSSQLRVCRGIARLRLAPRQGGCPAARVAATRFT